MSLNGEVTTWFMTEEQRLAYIEKHPIIQTGKPKGSSFAEIYDVAAYKKKQAALRGNENRWKDHK